ncbi:PAS domain-containing protein [candidate division GN15 bacterium]|nr:PAS domain-containing protein [candidate division GN15 bacterium]
MLCLSCDSLARRLRIRFRPARYYPSGSHEVDRMKPVNGSLLSRTGETQNLQASVFKLALECAGLAFWDQDFRTGQVVRSALWFEMLGYCREDLEGHLDDWKGLIHPDDLPRTLETAFRHESSETATFSVEHRMRTKDGRWRWIHNWGAIVERDGNGEPLRALGFHRDITDRKEHERALQAVRDELEQQVREQTAQLRDANQQLESDQAALRQKNVALRELLQELESSKAAMSRQIQTKINRLSRPLLAQLEADTNPRVRRCAQILRQSLDQLVASSGSNVGSEFDRLSRREFQICEMIRNGMNTKDIALVLGTSPETVRKQRSMIRHKLGLTNSSTNLSSYLRRLGSEKTTE